MFLPSSPWREVWMLLRCSLRTQNRIHICCGCFVTTDIVCGGAVSSEPARVYYRCR